MAQRKFEWTDEIETKFNEAFDRIDQDHNGKLTFDELKNEVMTRGLRLMGHNPTDDDIKKHMHIMDTDGDGVVSRDEFKNYIRKFMEAMEDPDEEMMRAFEVMFRACDIDQNGLISKAEFAAFMAKSGRTISDEQMDMLFTAVDTDGDTATLTKQELLTIFKIGKAVTKEKGTQNL